MVVTLTELRTDLPASPLLFPLRTSNLLRLVLVEYPGDKYPKALPVAVRALSSNGYPQNPLLVGSPFETPLREF
jgi:hypothetical protein